MLMEIFTFKQHFSGNFFPVRMNFEEMISFSLSFTWTLLSKHKVDPCKIFRILYLFNALPQVIPKTLLSVFKIPGRFNHYLWICAYDLFFTFWSMISILLFLIWPVVE